MTTSEIVPSRHAVAAAPETTPGGIRAVWRPPLLWRALLVMARFGVPLFCRLRVIDDMPEELRGRTVILASNHIGNFDPLALAAACQRRRMVPRILATGGLFRAPVIGAALRRCGHIRVDRAEATAVAALGSAVDAIRGGAVVAGYPEGRVTLDPGMWPERARTGMARLALATGAPVVPVSQWGSHEVMTYDSPAAMAARLIISLWRRPVVTVRFGVPVDLCDLSAGVPIHAQHASNRIMGAVMEGLRPLRSAEPTLPRYLDPTRPVSAARTFSSRRGSLVAGLPNVGEYRLAGGPYAERGPRLGDPPVGRP